MRSKAVHGAKIKGDAVSAIEESERLLCNLIVKCVEGGALPDESDLVP